MSYEILMLICWCFHYVFNTINTSSHNLHWVHLGIKGKSSCLEILRGQIIAVESNKKARRVLQFQTQKNVIEMLQYHNIHTDGKIINYGSKLSYAMQTVPFNVRCTLQYNAICQEGGGGSYYVCYTVCSSINGWFLALFFFPMGGYFCNQL